MNQPSDPNGPPSVDELPAVYREHLDRETFERLISDLEVAATIHEVRLKAGAELMANDDTIDLWTGADAVRTGRASALQIRYTHGGQVWSDTIMRTTGEGYVIVRMAQPF